MKIYTKTGDKGETSLLGGKRTSKSCLEIQVIGELDELNAALGVVVAQLSSPPFQGEVGLPATLSLARRAGVVAEDGSRQANRRQTPSTLPLGKGEMTLIEFLQNIQRDLFKIGAELASLQTSLAVKITKINSDSVDELEKTIDEFWSQLPDLQNFILPGGNLAAAHLHLARAVCRRAERALVAFGDQLQKSEVRSLESDLRPELKMYLNRLSDFLFAAARWVNFKVGEEEIKV